MQGTLPTLENYETFLEDEILKPTGMMKLENYYDNTVASMKKDFEESDFFVELKKKMQTYNHEYTVDTSYSLLTTQDPIEIQTKSFDSMISKYYREDILNNTRWKEEGFSFESSYPWTNPLNCFGELTDILRTRISAKYLDGPLFLLDKLIHLAESNGLEHNHKYKADEEGYYAIHFYAEFPFEISSLELEPIKIKSKVEFQLNTGVQDLIIDLTHKYYEKRRMKALSPDKWQWDFRCDEFIPNYLGHIIHYIEGMIMEVRERPE